MNYMEAMDYAVSVWSLKDSVNIPVGNLTEWLTFAKCEELFADCERLVTGVKVGVSVPLELNTKDSDIIVEIVTAFANDQLMVYRHDVLKARTKGMFFKWLKQKGRL